MNKQEAIERMKREQFQVPYGPGIFVHAVFADKAIELINQIHEPQTVVVPKHIADKIEYCKDTEGYGLFHAMDYCYQYRDSAEWLEDNQETFARAWLDGFEIEQEKLYTVEIPNPNRSGKGHAKFMLEKIGNEVVLVKRKSKECYQNKSNQKLTEAEIKQDFDWAWNAGFAKEVE
ncbi:DUF1642 domain-containing protein [Streptococcus suis]|uniref:DUF1642 domain-containing protein n=1 Tax=Streptococcus suis TaxID=1307 RepID=UPI0014781D5C